MIFQLGEQSLVVSREPGTLLPLSSLTARLEQLVLVIAEHALGTEASHPIQNAATLGASRDQVPHEVDAVVGARAQARQELVQLRQASMDVTDDEGAHGAFVVSS